MSSPKITKMILSFEGTGEDRVYEWKEDNLTMAELVVFLNMVGKAPDTSRWLEDRDAL